MGGAIRLKHTKDGTPCVWLYLGTDPITHKPIRRYREFKGMADAEALEAARRWRDDLTPSAATSSTKLAEALALYVAQLEAQGRSFNTVKTYRLYSRRYAAPLARVAVGKVTTLMLDSLFLALLTNGPKGGNALSANTVRKFREFLKGAFRYFVGLGLADANPVPETMRIQPTKHDAHALDTPDLQMFMERIRKTLADTSDTPRAITRRNAAIGMLTALHTGARRGEVCALRRRDIDLRKGLMTISGSVVMRDGQHVRQERTKGKRTRTVVMPAALCDALKSHLEWQGGYLPKADRNTPICTTDGTHMSPDTLTDQFRRYRDALGLDPLATFHGLRHTHATMLLQGGTEIQTVAERLGHAQASTTLNTYAHVLEGRDRKAAEVFDGMVNDACE